MKKGIDIKINGEHFAGCIDPFGKLFFIVLCCNDITDATLKGSDLLGNIKHYFGLLHPECVIEITMIDEKQLEYGANLYFKKTDSELLKEYYELKEFLNK